MTLAENTMAIYIFSVFAMVLMIIISIVSAVFIGNPSRVKPYHRRCFTRLLWTLVATCMFLLFFSVKLLLRQ